jgi:hypothetical protein
MFCGNHLGGKALSPAVASLLLVVSETAEAASTPPRAAHIGKHYVLVIPQQLIDPGDRRPR